MSEQAAPNLPGRLGTPDMQLRDDPRADPRMIAAMAPFALDGMPPPSPVDSSSPDEAIYEHCAVTEAGFAEVFSAFFDDLPPLDVSSRTEIIKGVDGNDINLYIHRPSSIDGPMPGIVHTHGGGMVLGTAADPNYQRWRDELAATGMVVVGVEFRNGAGKLGNYPFPAGLNDCSSGLQWTFDHKDELGLSSIVVSGESGGGNLALAIALKAKRDGRIDQIDGVYAQCPYISNAYDSGDPNLVSLVENDGYFLSSEMMGPLAKIYDPPGENATNPLAWPYHAAVADLGGLPPHVISVNQLDPLRDEGLAYFSKLLAAGVPTISRTVNGTCHAGDLLFRKAMPEVFAASVADLNAFASSL
ncbi:MAG: alpha/beta hydrolase [Acidimicrobiia bacterium]|nr:alpha/beta hydrolase [Acidimicrobiia bacterium]